MWISRWFFSACLQISKRSGKFTSKNREYYWRHEGVAWICHRKEILLWTCRGVPYFEFCVLCKFVAFPLMRFLLIMNSPPSFVQLVESVFSHSNIVSSLHQVYPTMIIQWSVLFHMPVIHPIEIYACRVLWDLCTWNSTWWCQRCPWFHHVSPCFTPVPTCRRGLCRWKQLCRPWWFRGREMSKKSWGRLSTTDHGASVPFQPTKDLYLTHLPVDNENKFDCSPCTSWIMLFHSLTQILAHKNGFGLKNCSCKIIWNH